MIAWHQYVMYTRDWSFFSLFWPRIETTNPAKGWVFSSVFCFVMYFHFHSTRNSA